MPEPQDDVARFMVVEHETEIRAPAARVWTALTEEIGRWWRPGFYALPDAAGMRLEPIVGGRMYEWTQDGSSVVWFSVIGVRPGRSLDLAGHLTVAFGGPAVALLRFDVTERGDGCTVKVAESRIGCVASDAAPSTKHAWSLLLDRGLKPWVEKPA